MPNPCRVWGTLNIPASGKGERRVRREMKPFKLIALAMFLACLLAMIYNVVPVGAQYTTMTIVSDENTEWFDPSEGVWKSAVPCWTHPSWPTITGATWIWRTYQTDPAWEYNNVPYYPETDEYYWTFRRIFYLPDDAYKISGELVTITADNAYKIYINGVFIGGDGRLHRDGPDNQEWRTVENYYYFDGMLKPGENVIMIKAVNFFSWGPSSSNPAGLIYKVVLTYERPIEVSIDVKPGSFPNSICLSDQGLLPVAILRSADFDVNNIDPQTVNLCGIYITLRGSQKKPKLAYSIEDVNGDGYMDFVAFFRVQDLVTAGVLAPDTTSLRLDGCLYDGTKFFGTDSVNIVPP
jgi:hypothetical protein